MRLNTPLATRTRRPSGECTMPLARAGTAHLRGRPTHPVGPVPQQLTLLEEGANHFDEPMAYRALRVRMYIWPSPIAGVAKMPESNSLIARNLPIACSTQYNDLAVFTCDV
jgi:hypothetical protein